MKEGRGPGVVLLWNAPSTHSYTSSALPASYRFWIDLMGMELRSSFKNCSRGRLKRLMALADLPDG